jgi:hypothetical protein
VATDSDIDNVDMDIVRTIVTTPLAMAALLGNDAEVNALLASLSADEVHATDALGMTALHWAAAGGHVSTVQALLKRSCLSTRNTQGLSALDIAQRNRQEALVHAKCAEMNRNEALARAGRTRAHEYERIVTAIIDTIAQGIFGDMVGDAFAHYTHAGQDGRVPFEMVVHMAGFLGNRHAS